MIYASKTFGCKTLCVDVISLPRVLHGCYEHHDTLRCLDISILITTHIYGRGRVKRIAGLLTSRTQPSFPCFFVTFHC